jgi:hypothetical protein
MEQLVAQSAWLPRAESTRDDAGFGITVAYFEDESRDRSLAQQRRACARARDRGATSGTTHFELRIAASSAPTAAATRAEPHERHPRHHPRPQGRGEWSSAAARVARRLRAMRGRPAADARLRRRRSSASSMRGEAAVIAEVKKASPRRA